MPGAELQLKPCMVPRHAYANGQRVALRQGRRCWARKNRGMRCFDAYGHMLTISAALRVHSAYIIHGHMRSQRKSCPANVEQNRRSLHTPGYLGSRSCAGH